MSNPPHILNEMDLSRIELLSPQCECDVLPLYYRPSIPLTNNIIQDKHYISSSVNTLILFSLKILAHMPSPSINFPEKVPS